MDSLIKYHNVLFNGVERMSESNKYFNTIQKFGYFNNEPQKGLHVKTFVLYPLDNQLSGTSYIYKIENE